MGSLQISEDVRRYIATEFLDGDDQDLEHHSPLLEWGILDSVGMVKLVGYLESRFGIRIPQADITPTNFRDLTRIANMVSAHAAPANDVELPAASTEVDAELQELLDFGASAREVALAAGATLHVVEMPGPGATWVLLPEPGEPATFYDDVQRALEGEYRSLAIDLAGFGRSTAEARPPTFHEHVALVTELLDLDTADRYVLVGHGLSSLVALEVARRTSKQLLGVVTLGFGELEEPRSLLGDAGDARAFLAARRRHASSVGEAQLAAYEARLSTPAYAAFLDASTGEAVSSLLASTEAPVLFFGAQEDALVPEAAVESAAAKTPSAEVKWLARAGHAFPKERGDETVSMIKKFVEGLV